MDLNFQLTEDDWRDAIRTHAKPYLPRLVGQLVFAGFVLTLGLLSANGPVATGGAVFFLWSVYALVKTLLLPRLTVRKRFRGGLMADLRFTICWSDSGLHYQTQLYDCKVMWKWWTRWAEGKTVITIHDQNGAWMIIPTRIFDEQQLIIFKELLCQHVGGNVHPGSRACRKTHTGPQPG